MTRTIHVLLLLLVFNVSFAQRGYNHLNLDAGINTQGNWSYNLGLELNKGDFSAWEIAIEAHFSEFSEQKALDPEQPDIFTDVTEKEELYLGGVYYKPLIFKKRNLVFNFRLGLLAGRTDTFVMAAGAGLELTYHLPSLFAIYIKQSNHYIINIDERFRHSINLGIKIPL